MIRPKHIRTRLAVWYTVVMAAVLALFTSGILFFFHHGLREEFDRNLLEHYERGARHLEKGADGSLHLRKPEKTTQNPNRDFGQEIALEAWSPHRQILFKSEALGGNELGEPPAAVSARSVESKAPFRIMTGKTYVAGQEIILRVGMDEGRLWNEIRELILIVLLLSPLALALAGGAGYWMAMKALAPVERMSHRAEVISADKLSERLPVENPDDELGALASVLNRLFDRLERSFGELKRFTSDASHELRTPLQALKSIGEVALQKNQDAAYYREVISSMLEETDRISKLTHSLLTLSRADAGAVKLMRTSADLSEIVLHTTHLLEVLAEEKGQKLRTEIASRPVAHVDPVIFPQALVNLVDNAIKYSGPGTEICVRLFESAEGPVIEVADQGPGIAEEHRQFVFERFFRVDKSRSRDLGGAGLGLAIARWSIESHGGKLHLESHVGRGSTFRIILPS